MARTRTQRRRQNTLIAVALVATALVLLLARDINRAAHSATDVRRSENRAFARLANGLISRENALDQHLAYLLTHGSGLSRAVFTARLAQLADQLPQWTADAGLLRRPAIAGDLNTQLAQMTEQRVDDYQTVVDAVAHGLDLPWTNRAATTQSSDQARASLLDTNRRWDRLRTALAAAPGRATLEATSTAPAVVTLPTVLADLEAAASLRVTRGVSISAVEVTPSPLPAPAGEILLPPVTSVHLGVSVTNAAFVRQPVTLTVTLTPTSGTLGVQNQRMSVVLGPTRSFAFVPRLLATAPGERATLTLTLSGAPAAPGAPRTRTYHVVLSPSGATG